MPDATFKYGRTDCANSPSTNEVFEFPEGTMNKSAMLEYFADHFGYTTDEVVALMGAHSTVGHLLAKPVGNLNFAKNKSFVMH